MAPVTCFGYQRSFVLIVATLIVPMTGVAAYPQHPHRASQPASSDPALAESQQSMQSMHETMSSLESAGNDDVDFVQLMLPHHQGAIDVAKVQMIGIPSAPSAFLVLFIVEPFPA